MSTTITRRVNPRIAKLQDDFPVLTDAIKGALIVGNKLANEQLSEAIDMLDALGELHAAREHWAYDLAGHIEHIKRVKFKAANETKLAAVAPAKGA